MPELDSVGYLLRHKKSGARVVLLSNEDENKVFSIAFRTPPSDSTGAPHILEHTVLCGSRDFPVKDPFIELAKGSLNTFLNAMTYPDKTVFPVASCNDQDFQNLMHVYLDAVFYPNIYKEEKIFRQEGWHYELESPEAELAINGVVYNEMKGAFSSVEDQLEREIMSSLYPDTPYFHESGGHPKHIPELSWEGFLDFHRKYYHPSNSYLYLYGNMDMEEKLRWIDEHYLSHYEYCEIDSEIALQQPFAAPVEKTVPYSIPEEESPEGKAYLSYSVSMGSSLDAERSIAFEVLDYALLSAPGAPLKQALLDAGIGKDVFSQYDNGTAQLGFSVIAKHADASQKDAFVELIRKTLADIVKNGFDRKSLEAGINYYEFRYREADFGSYPKGLMYGLQILDSWIYDEKQPFLHLLELESFAKLKSRLNGRYFEELVETWLLNNPHRVILTLSPEPGLEAREAAELREKLQIYKESLGESEREALVEATHALKSWQDEEDAPEELEKIPMLTRQDIRREIKPYVNRELQADGIPVLHQDIFTAGISYISLLFDATKLPDELLPYLGFLKYVIGYVDTANYDYRELYNEINCHTGGISFMTNLYTDRHEHENYRLMFEIRSRVLTENTDFAFAMIREIVKSSKLEDYKRLREILSEVKSQAYMGLVSGGHSAAALRARAKFSRTARISERLAGITFYQFVEEMDHGFEEKKEELARKLRLVAEFVLRPENLTVSCTSRGDGLEAAEKEIPALKQALMREAVTLPVEESSPQPVPALREGITIPSPVQYVARAGHISRYTGAYHVLKVILSYEYLWSQVRVKGGAYGCMSGFGVHGDAFLVSYRDPNLRQTNEIFEKTVDYVAQFDADEREMTKYIIGAFSELDTPLTPRAAGSRSLTAWLTHTTEEEAQKVRDEALDAQPADICALAAGIQELLDEGSLCVVGNAEHIEQDRDLFDVIFSVNA
ncbi:MAG: insulinase family protein [Lachnospiraceae bacterium]|nr:insulinase family protein [Lachnospiraceae bacterium]